MNKQTVKFDIKKLNDEEGIFEGYAAAFNNVDYGNDKIVPGAFKKSISERGNQIKILWQHKRDQPIGKSIEVKEDDYGLWVKGKISMTEKGKEAYQLMKDGVIDALSIGYNIVKKEYKDGVRLLKELKLGEFSPVTFPMNPAAQITNVKSVVDYLNLPLAERDFNWSADEAEARIREWAGGKKENINWDKYKKAFFYRETEESENFTDYKLPYADIINGKLTAIPRAIFTVAGVLQGAMGGVDISEEDENAVKEQVEKYYEKMRKEFEDEEIIAPWNSKDLYSAVDNLETKILIWNLESKIGRVLSTENFELIQKVIQVLQSLLNQAEPSDEDTQDEEADRQELLNFLNEIIR